MNLFEYTYNLVRQIPSGKISSYGAVAKALGDIRASRAVGRMMNQNPDADDMPCFKIVHSDGKLGGFGLGLDDKIRRLQNDGISVQDGVINQFDSVFYDSFDTDYPLQRLHQEQIDLASQIITDDAFQSIETVAGFDIAYPKNEFEPVCGAGVVLDYQTHEILEEKTVFATVDFPYIPTYLFYREFPVIRQVYHELSCKPSISMIDGNGILHPAKTGIASQIGIALDSPTIGVAKSLLTGTVQEGSVYIDNDLRGRTYHATPQVKNPIYISSGHKICLETATNIVKTMCTHRIPEPLRQAHRLATTTLRER